MIGQVANELARCSLSVTSVSPVCETFVVCVGLLEVRL